MYLQDYVLDTSHTPDPLQWQEKAKELSRQIAKGEYVVFSCTSAMWQIVSLFFSIYQECATSTGRHHTTPLSSETFTPSVVCPSALGTSKSRKPDPLKSRRGCGDIPTVQLCQTCWNFSEMISG